MTFVTCTGAEAFQWVAEARARLERTPADTGDRQSPPRRQALQLLFRKDPDQAGQCPGNRPASAKGLEAQGGLVWPGLGAGPWSPRGLREETAGVRGGRTAVRGAASQPHSARAGPSSKSRRHWSPQTLLRRGLAAPGSRPCTGPPAGCPADAAPFTRSRS